jgi:SAM-dependent methyltransferase
VDVVERLSPEEVSEPTLIALTHVHRYQLAAELCAGLRVVDVACGTGYGSRILAETAAKVTGIDLHEPSIEDARAQAADDPKLRFECGDAVELLGRELGREFDAIVLFEALEHLDQIDAAIEALHRHAAAGLMVIVSLPNSITFGERNPHHVNEFDVERARDAFRRIGASKLLYQFHADGSLIRGADDGPLTGASTLPERAELEHANHLIAIANPPAGHDASGAWARVRLGVAPALNTYMLDLERANRRLWRTNRQLARERLGVADSAAAATLDRIRSRAGPGLEGQGVGRRLGNRIKRAITLVVPHGIVLTVMRLRAERDRERALGPDRR